MTEETQTTEIAVIGGGIAGAGVAAELAALNHRIILLEAEDRPGYHTTGRSAALFSKTYGPAPIRALSAASEAVFEAGGTAPFLRPRGALMIARPDQMDALDRFAGEMPKGATRRLDPDGAIALNPLLRRDYVGGAVIEDSARDIDVDAVHSHFLSRLRSAGGTLMVNARVEGMTRKGDGWTLATSTGTISAGVVVNAAGAWADKIAEMAGAHPVGLVPKRRTALLVAAPDGLDMRSMAMAIDVEEQFYLKPDAGALLLSPADETPSEPCDAAPEEIDIAICVDRIERAFDLNVRRITHSWAGLRSFVADKCPVAGYDPAVPGFFWLAGQGGYGIQTAPALSRLAAALVTGRNAPADILDRGLNVDDLSPSRPALRSATP